jgi:hypothetical protein
VVVAAGTVGSLARADSLEGGVEEDEAVASGVDAASGRLRGGAEG